MGGGGSGLGKLIANFRLAGRQTEANQELVKKQYEIVNREIPDRILYNSLASYPLIWGLDNPGKAILISALPYLHYVRGHSHVAFNHDLGPFINRLTYALANFGMVITTLITARWLDLKRKITPGQINKALNTSKAIYAISPALFPRPDYWEERLQVLGFHERDKAANWNPDEGLLEFLEDHQDDRILLVTFGSMTNPETVEKSRVIVQVLARNKIPAVINTASGGLVKLDRYDPELIHFVSRIPYHWIFPKMYGVIHHGGSGTTHLALKYGCATLVIPHIIDQFVWDGVVSGLGAGPKGIKIGDLSVNSLEPKILDLVNNVAYKKKAEQVAGQMAQEDLREELYQAIITG